MGFSRQEYWRRLPCPSPGDLPDPWVEPLTLMSLELAGGFFTTSVTWEAWRTVWRFLKRLKIELPYDTETPLLGIYLEKNMIQKDTWTLIFIAALFTTVKTWKQPRCPSIKERVKKMWYIYKYNGISLSH